MKLFRTFILTLIYFSLTTFPAYANIKVGTTLYYPPYVMSTGTGFDPQLLEMICQRLKTKCDIITMDYNQLFIALNSGTIDIAMSGIIFPVESETQYIYSLPYASSKSSFMVLQKSHIESTNDLRGKKVGILKATTGGDVFLRYLLINYPEQFQTLKYPHLEDLVDALNKGAIDAAFTNDATTTYWKMHGDGKFKTIGNPVELGDGIGIIATAKNAELMTKINQQIELLRTDKSYLTLYAAYFNNVQ